MSEIIITTKRGVYGRVNVTLPLTIKTTILAWQKKSGMKRAEFLRLALTTGFLELSRGIVEGNVEVTGQSDDGARSVRPRPDDLRPSDPGLS